MMTRFKEARWPMAMFGALLCTLVFGVLHPVAGLAQAGPAFTVAVESLASCAGDAPVAGTVTLAGLAREDGFTVQLRGDGAMLDSYAVGDSNGNLNGTHPWAVSSLPGDRHDLLELAFALTDGNGDPIRTEVVVLNPDCDQVSNIAPDTAKASPITVIPATSERNLASGANNDRESDPVLVAGFAGATVLVLTALAFLDRREP